MLRHDAFEAAFEACLEQLDTVLFDVVGHEDVAACLHGLPEANSPACERLAEQRLLFEIEGIEREVGDWDFVFARRATGEALAQACVVGAAVGVCRHQLAVDHASRGNAGRRGADLGQVRSQVVQAAILDVHFAFGVAEEHASESVPLDLEEVFR